ncbi:DNA primase [Campylobacter sp. MIT 21-1685]|uniref:DNA primase n=1 Tax=unclassified Campylobacter TaxID=2593542 RepID=UPI00224A8ABD|nr:MULTISPECIES: DNA primase [unclassified Campylobacter]MCX2683285.1 DNA primase [Campylobacter sp. MIT 21-1684]MCX2751522.1 DNA primase [Campylobacter sp. MIT 21-1682]MCX2807721.1 DNA primase [Campylobacter sp. MIT 21-1685]
MIARASIESLSQKLDIVDIISHFIEVKKQGASYVCVCPFHPDKNPSMHINSQKSFYHCFACKAGGDAFKFVMDYEKLSFAEAVEKVASLSNFSLSYTQEKQENKKELKHILPILNAFYKHSLIQHKEALSYLYSRKLNDADILKFELGFAGTSEESMRLLRNENISYEDALTVGALKKDEKNELYASFIARIIFPIYDHKGLLVGFGGRTLNPNNMAKYINSPQNILFDKSRIFYGLHLAKENIMTKKEMIICEGYLDVIAFHKAGFNNAIAILGTALTQSHLPLIRRYEAKVILCFDNDEAGLKAAIKSSFLLSTHKFDGKVVLLQGGKDPAELVACGEEKRLFDFLDKGIELGEFYIRNLLKEPIKSALEKQKALEKVQAYTFLLEPLVANSYKNLVAKLLGVDEIFVTLSKNERKRTVVTSNVPFKETNHLAEFEIFAFLQTSSQARELFKKISDTMCFKHKNLLEKILLNYGFEDSEIREFENKKLQKILSENEFLFGISKINLAFLNTIELKTSSLALKKQLFACINQNEMILKKNLNNNELKEFLIQLLLVLKNERDEKQLEFFLKKFHSIFNRKNFKIQECKSLFENSNEPF